MPEGDDKPAKYPVMFRAADLVLLSKADLLPVLDDFDPVRAEDYLRHLASSVPFEQVAIKGGGDRLAPWLNWLRTEVTAQGRRRAAGKPPVLACSPTGHDCINTGTLWMPAALALALALALATRGLTSIYISRPQHHKEFR